MRRNRGTLEGDIHERRLVEEFNSNKYTSIFSNYTNDFSSYDTSQIYMVRVTTEQFSKLSNQNVMTRADAYLIYSADNKLENLLLSHNYYLDEEMLIGNNISYSKINYSGLSIKLPDSSNYQILKLTPNSFKTLFGVSELGVGACLYCAKEQDLPKNLSLIKGWLSTPENMGVYFSEIIKDFPDFYLNKEICKKIKKYSEQEIRKLIDNSKELQQKIFNGIHLYEEPYTAYYLSHNDKITNLSYIPYNITTGSGRSRGDYTLVLKPR